MDKPLVAADGAYAPLLIAQHNNTNNITPAKLKVDETSAC